MRYPLAYMFLMIRQSLIVVLLMSTTLLAQAAKPFHSWALTPPMGWNSWDCYGAAVTEDQTKANADYMADKLLKHGWNLITVDIQWYEPGAIGHEYRKDAPLVMDEFGRLQPALNRFPSAANNNGFKSLSKYVHDKGLIFGIHMMRGIPRLAVDQNLPIKGTSYHAADIADKKHICPWNPDMYGIDMTKPGAQEYYDSVMEMVADWGVDFVKIDDLSRPYHQNTPEIEALRKAIDKTGRKIVFSTSPGETPLDAADHVTQHANMWRISDDFWDNWKLLKDQFTRCKNWAKYNAPGHYPDADMLALGAVRVGQKDPWTKFTHDEQITHMTLWSICKSPLIFGGDMPKNDAWTLSLMTNDEVIAVNQAGLNAREVSDDKGLIVWSSGVPNSKDKYIALFNTRDLQSAKDLEGLDVTIKFESLGLPAKCKARDLWRQEELGEVTGALTQRVRHHGAMLFRVTPVE